MTRIRNALSYANVTATVALFIALGGGAYAAIVLPDNSVRSRHIAKAQVRASDIARNAVTSRKVADSSLLAKDFQAGQLPAGPKGDTGARGPQGSAGADGARGPSDVFGATFADRTIPEAAASPFNLAELDLSTGSYVVSANANVSNETTADVSVTCAVGTPGVGASGQLDFAADVVRLTLEPNPAGAGEPTDSLYLTGVVELAAPDAISLDCYLGWSGGSSGANVVFSDIDVGALQVAAIHTP